MSLKKRLIPVLLLKNGRMVKTIQFDQSRDVGDPIKAAKVYDSQRVDELVFLDIAASVESRQTLFEIAARSAEECFMPLTIGGGIRSLNDIRELLRLGADKVSINTIALERPDFINESSRRFGCQCIVVSMDVRRQAHGYEVFAHGGRKATGLDPVQWARTAAERGAGEILLYSIDRDGTMSGYDLELIQSVSDSVNIPVIACGGVGTLEHLAQGITEGHASAVAAASLFHFTDQNPIKARTYLMGRGLDVRSIGKNF